MSESNRQIAQKAYETPSSVSTPKSSFKPILKKNAGVRSEQDFARPEEKELNRLTPFKPELKGKKDNQVKQLKESLGLDETPSPQMPTDSAPVKEKGIKDYSPKDKLAILAKSLGQ